MTLVMRHQMSKTSETGWTGQLVLTAVQLERSER